ncbi:RpnC/YadD family protein [Actinomadura macrotermitis]|uniref:Uncharacterized protein n=1 Tax=Actinomadura macrotermitis TaxID=2585200 RepID=A0A7K0BPG3_9ACTN|nr:hypothetical protein [Actinomadura macrotermitis]MQY03090.1 hypothetical protein [Actinomadura macrotermitis]
MPTQIHDITTELFRWNPELAAELLDGIGLAPPGFLSAREVSESFTDHKTSEYTGDAAVLLELEDDRRHGVVVEHQHSEKDGTKDYTWLLYLATLRARHRCQATLLVIASDPGIAAKCAAPIETGHPELTLRPVVVCPEHVPVLTDPHEIVADPALGVLSALFHSAGAQRQAVLEAACEASKLLADDDRQLARRYYDYVNVVVPEKARAILEDLMKVSDRFYSDLLCGVEAEGIAKGRVEGEAKGKVKGKLEAKAESVITVLEARGVTLPPKVRGRILNSRDLDELDDWLVRAATVGRAEEIFG